MRTGNTKYAAPDAHLNSLRTAQDRTNRNNCDKFMVAHNFPAKNSR